MPEEEPNFYEAVNLVKNPFEAQGEYDPDVSLEIRPLRTEKLQTARGFIRMVEHDRKLVVATIIGEPAAGKTFLVKQLAKGEERSRQAKHIYLKTGIGPPGNHLYLLSQIVEALRGAMEELDSESVKSFLNARSEDQIKTPINVPGFIKEGLDESVMATNLLNQWFDYISALREIGGFRAVAIYLDELEDRWGMGGVSQDQREMDLVYLRDLIGFVQDTKELAGVFPVALFFCMTYETWAQIGADNNALQSRLQRPIILDRFTQDEAKKLLKEKLAAFRIGDDDDFAPFSEESVDTLLDKSTSESGDFNFRLFLINCHDILFHFAQKFFLSEDDVTPISKKNMLDWLRERGKGPAFEPIGPSVPGSETLTYIEVNISGDEKKTELWNRLKEDLIANKRLQFEYAVRNIPRILSDNAPQTYLEGEQENMLLMKIPDLEAQIPVKVLSIHDGREERADHFVLYVSGKEKMKKLSSHEAMIQLPEERMIAYAIYDTALLPPSEKERAIREVQGEILNAIERGREYFEMFREERYMPHSIDPSPNRLGNLVEELQNLVVMGHKKRASARLRSIDVFNGVQVSDPYWLAILRRHRIVPSPQKLHEDFFDFNTRVGPIEGAIAFLTTIGMLDEDKFRNEKDYKLSLAKNMDRYQKEVDKERQRIEKELKETLPDGVSSQVENANSSLDDLRKEIMEFKPRPTSVMENFVWLYARSLKGKQVREDAVETLSDYMSSAREFAVIRDSAKFALDGLKQVRFKNSGVLQQLKKLRKKAESALKKGKFPDSKTLRSRFEEIHREAEDFIREAQKLEREFEELPIDDIIKGAKKGLLDDESYEKIVNEFGSGDSLQEARELIEKLRQAENKLMETANSHLKNLKSRYEESSQLVNQLRKHLKETKLKAVRKLVKKIGDAYKEAGNLWMQNRYLAVLDVDVGEHYRGFRPALLELFGEKDYFSVEEFSKLFNVDKNAAGYLVHAFARAGIIEAYYRVVKE